ncbi:AAA family ATPase [Microbacterium sp. G2-8]|uniref:nucleotide-binding protein n=1 Tax=Microbacterium sp. G2-8 TaxID=2842454 RepID=UPI0021A9EB07|nr:AAA family ATPase [Microbacterium sp. G2-8]
MAADRKTSRDELDDNGVLGDVGIDTTAIDLGGTSQVRVHLPAGYRDDDADDGVTADEITPDGLHDVPVRRAASDDDVEDESDDVDAEDDVTDDAVLETDDTVEPDGDADVVDIEGTAHEMDVDDLAPDELPADVVARGGAEDDVEDDGEHAVGDPADDAAASVIDSIVEDVSNGDEAPTAVDEVPEPETDGDADAVDDEADDVSLVEDVPPGDDSIDDATAEPVDDPVAAADESASEDARSIDDAVLTEQAGEDGVGPDLSDHEPGAVVSESAADLDEIETAIDQAASAERGADDSEAAAAADEETDTVTARRPGHVPAPAPRTPSTEAPVRATEIVPAPATEDDANTVEPVTRDDRRSFLRPPARRAGEVTSAAARESSDVLTEDRLLDSSAIRKPEPVDPWRRIVYSATGGLINLGDGRKTRARREQTARIAAPLSGRARFVGVLSRKGGVGKTTVSALLGMALADARDDRVIAVDANPDRGTLAERISHASGKTVRDVVRGRDEIRGYGDMSALVVRDDTRLDVLASDTDPHVSEAFSDEDYRTVAAVAEHYYSIVLTDTGTGIVHSVMDAALDLADQIVIVAGRSLDEARLASETLTWLETNGFADEAQNAIVVLNQDGPGKAPVRLDELESHFRTRARAVVRLPYDARLATGGAIAFHELDSRTRDAARDLAALVVEGIRGA